MGNKDPRVDAYIDKAADFAKPVLIHLRDLVHAACPDVEENWKWSMPVFYHHGPMCNMAAFKAHCSFGFWKASLMDNADGALSITDREGMGHMGKITSLKDLPKDAVLKKLIKTAMKLNEEDVKVPKKPKPTEKEKKELVTPADLIKELKKNKKAMEVFDKFSYSHRKEYIQWFDEAKTDVTRNKRIAQAILWMEEGKDRNWKYKNC